MFSMGVEGVRGAEGRVLSRGGKGRATIWQGFHHAWEYNHRLNRLGSYVRDGGGGAGNGTVVGHTAASGTGGDWAHFSEFVTRVEAANVGFQTGRGEALVECPRAVTTSFRIRVDELELTPDLVGRERYAVVINGFDLWAEQHADKLITFDLEVTDPVVYAGGTRIRFDIVGSMCFDCRTAECTLWPVGLEVNRVGQRPDTGQPDTGQPGAREVAGPGAGMPDDDVPPTLEERRRKRGIQKRPALEQGVDWLKRQVARITDLESVKEDVLARNGDRLRRRLFRLFGHQFMLRLLKLRILTPYALRVEYVIVGGDADALSVTESPLFENTYAWDTETEIERAQRGTQRISVGGANPEEFDVNTFGFKQLFLETTLDQGYGASNPIQWGKGMHLLEWDAAVRDIEVADGRVGARLDLFFKVWSEAMNEVITFTTWGALRSAGSARLGARLMLLQFREGSAETLELPGHIHWPGGGRSARTHPRALYERPARWEGKAENSG